MSFLDKLSSLIKIDVSKFKSLKLISDNSIQQKIINDNRSIIINIGTQDVKDQSKLKEIIREAVKVEGILLIEEQAKKTLEDLKETNNDTAIQDTLSFFKKIIPYQDHEILRAAFYIKTVYSRGESIRNLKWDIIQRYGSRGKNIVNLCTAGYFDSVIKPIYEEMSSQAGFSLEKFHSYYNKIVTQYTFAVFVNKRMSKEALKNEVEKKIKINKQYGIQYLNIHGIGTENVSKIINLLADIQKLFSKPPEIDSGQGIIIVKIWF